MTTQWISQILQLVNVLAAVGLPHWTVLVVWKDEEEALRPSLILVQFSLLASMLKLTGCQLPRLILPKLDAACVKVKLQTLQG